jgi:aryl-alcohol dehydrogenase-like predicted oxidoreductase
MDYTRLGNAGLKVSRICLGTNMLGGYVDEKASIELVHTFLDNGGNFIDGADIYTQGKSEEAIGKALKGRRQEAVLATKVHGAMGSGPNDKGTSRQHIMDGVEGSLRRLQSDYIDLYILHRWDPETPLEETLRAMEDLVRQGKVRYVGVSNFSAWQVMKALWVGDNLGANPIVSVQSKYSLLARAVEEEIIPVVQEQGLAFTPYGVLEAGMLTGKYQRGQAAPEGSRLSFNANMAGRMMREELFTIEDRVEHLANEKGWTPTDVTLAWALSKPHVASAIVGTSRPEQVKANCETVSRQLSSEEIEALESTPETAVAAR